MNCFVRKQYYGKEKEVLLYVLVMPFGNESQVKGELFLEAGGRETILARMKELNKRFRRIERELAGKQPPYRKPAGIEKMRRFRNL
jgi:hypothetical protein